MYVKPLDMHQGVNLKVNAMARLTVNTFPNMKNVTYAYR